MRFLPPHAMNQNTNQLPNIVPGCADGLQAQLGQLNNDQINRLLDQINEVISRE